MKHYIVGVTRLEKITIAQPDMLRGVHLKQINEWMSQWTIPNNYHPRATIKAQPTDNCDTNEAFAERQMLHSCGLITVETFIDETFQKFISSMRNALGKDVWEGCILPGDNNHKCVLV